MENEIDLSKKDVVLVDAYNLIYRAYHGTKSPMKAPDGMPTNALFTVIKMLQKLPQSFSNLEFCLAVFDGSGNNFRKELDENYKAHRKPMPDDLKVQMPFIEEAFRILGWPIFKADGVEADDVIGTMAVRAANKGYSTYIVSGDKDFRAIVKENLNIIDTMNDICYDPEKVKEKMGVSPDKVVEYLALVGDGADNVIGVDKVGPTTAAKWLNEFGSMDGIKNNLDKLKGVAADNLKKAIESGQIDKNLQLITMKLDVDIQLKAKDLRLKERNDEEFIKFCEKMNFMSLLKNVKPNP